ncbi:HD-GYP domain-containing protein [Sporohalobacter salinus]|uniref:HD-GYP domain-containing protein n=1 Tax=Sporohalobacter salinus TaxID=1494606 RepID=UPI00196141DA|nr:HD-GYP domain-containing protein [Sporohalobacter salinus]MBM7624178.1 putative nucleotidyltransferase with HDIG domain [Sporohalobacter salinus]
MISKNLNIHDVIEILITTLNVRDNYTFQHSWRVAELATMIAQEMNLTNEVVERVHQAAHLHDIGKIGVSDNILNKPGKLTEDEVKEMQKHPTIGYNILKKVSMFKSISTIVLYHHERYDGLGYPEGLKGEEIPLESRIITVADAFDAITSNRSYRQAQSYDYAYDEINDHVNEQFCPVVVKYFNKVFDLISSFLEKNEIEIKDNSISNYRIENINHNELIHSKKVGNNN